MAYQCRRERGNISLLAVITSLQRKKKEEKFLYSMDVHKIFQRQIFSSAYHALANDDDVLHQRRHVEFYALRGARSVS